MFVPLSASDLTALCTTSFTSIEDNNIGMVDMLEQIVPQPNELSFAVTVSLIVVATIMLLSDTLYDNNNRTQAITSFT